MCDPDHRADRETQGGVVLIVDDSAATRTQVRAALERSGCVREVLEADGGLAGYKIAAARRPDLIVSDLVMPGFDGFKLIALCSANPLLAEIPFVMLTAEDDVDRKVDLFDKGASDYVTKPFQDKELVARVRAHLRLKLAQDELRELSARFEALSNTDPLTQLHNRRYLGVALGAEVARAARYGRAFAVVMFDIDHFKRINDQHGHGVGDTVIANLAAVARASVREVDVVARYGGEEFVAVLPETDEAGAARVAERIRRALEVMDHGRGGVPLRATASFGVACYDAARSEDADALLARADEALYEAKRRGRNTVVRWGRGQFAANDADSGRSRDEPPTCTTYVIGSSTHDAVPVSQ